MKRYKFYDIFIENPNGSLTPKIPIRVNNVQFGHGVSFGAGASFGGVNFHQFKHLDIAVEEKNGIYEIKGFFKD